MNPKEEASKRQGQYFGEMGKLAMERYNLCKQIETCEQQIASIDEAMARLDGKVTEGEQARRDFDTYQAIQEGAVTLDQVKEAAETGKTLKVPKEAVKDLKPKPEAKKKAKAD